MFYKFDLDKSDTIEKEEALKYWTNNFAKINAEEFFKAVDVNNDGCVQFEEWVDWWKMVKGAGHEEAEIVEEVRMKIDFFNS